VIAGLISTLIPTAFFSHLFFTGHGFLGTLENVLIAPFIALISFVCSVGNIPFAATLWRFGISFGGAVSFIYADLISAPLLLIYRKYFGKNLAWRMLAVFWVVMSLGGLITEGIFQLFNWIPKRHQLRNLNESFGWNLDTVANIIALVVLIAVVVLAKSRKMSENQSFAIDPICKMQVRISDAPAKAEIAGATYYFCMEGCRDEFLKKHQA
jgi:YHS domain-containing protein